MRALWHEFIYGKLGMILIISAAFYLIMVLMEAGIL